jgi:hypothetical protein
MKTRLLPTLSLLTVLFTACAPVETQTRPPETASATPIIVELTATPASDLTATGASTDSLSSAMPPTVQAVATSRGPNLEATDPKTVSMASGGLQLVEFFEFW